LPFAGRGQPYPALRGPLLVDERSKGLWVPPPADARIVAPWEEDGSGESVKPRPWLGPRFLSAGHTFLPGAISQLTSLVKPTAKTDDRQKTSPLTAPVSLESAVDWAFNIRVPEEPAGRAGGPWSQGGEESRVHVTIQDETGTAADGALFRTAALRLPPCMAYVFALEWPDDIRQMLALRQPLVAASIKKREGANARLREGVVRLGGEGRLAELLRAEGDDDPFALASDLLAKKLAAAELTEGYLRLQLLTPGWFPEEHPYLPALPAGQRVVAMCADRFQSFSGWKVDNKSDGAQAPRAVRRVVPAGAVYWIGDTEGRPFDAKTLGQMIRETWLQPIQKKPLKSGVRPDHLGFGLCLSGFKAGKTLS
jgi:CRISPR type III-B/RAMP module-associated protein Cmr3